MFDAIEPFLFDGDNELAVDQQRRGRVVIHGIDSKNIHWPTFVRHDQMAAMVCTSTRKASLTNRSTIRSVFGGYLPSGNFFGNSRKRNAMNFGMSCEWTR